MIKSRFPLFGKDVEFRIYDVEHDDFITLRLMDDIYAEALRLQRIFNFYDPKSELNMLNRKRALNVSDELLFVLKNALKYSEMTHGKYDVTHGKNFFLRKSGLNIMTLGCSYKNIRIDGNSVKLLHKDVLIDLGSIAKGYIGDKIIDYMISLGIENGFVDARGDLRIFGNVPEIIGIQHPRADMGIHPMVFENAAVATSGDYNQYVKDFRNNHILGNKELISVTVMNESLMEADALATCLMVIGKEQAIRFCEEYHIQALLIDESLVEYGINGIEKSYLEGTEWIRN